MPTSADVVADKAAEAKYDREWLLKVSPAEFRTLSHKNRRYWVHAHLAFKRNLSPRKRPSEPTQEEYARMYKEKQAQKSGEDSEDSEEEYEEYEPSESTSESEEESSEDEESSEKEEKSKKHDGDDLRCQLRGLSLGSRTTAG